MFRMVEISKVDTDMRMKFIIKLKTSMGIICFIKHRTSIRKISVIIGNESNATKSVCMIMSKQIIFQI
uniref:Uncharacterized protein n=1 Tax=Triticum urartu TaxID=4572 RepID=A0A8R7UWI2_TRIUA